MEQDKSTEPIDFEFYRSLQHETEDEIWDETIIKNPLAGVIS